MDAIPAQLSVTPFSSAAQNPIQCPGTAYQLIRKASWETAIAAQVLGALPPDKVRGYELAYEEPNIRVDEERAAVEYWNDLHGYRENTATLGAEDHRAPIKELRRIEAHARFQESLGLCKCNQISMPYLERSE